MLERFSAGCNLAAQQVMLSEVFQRFPHLRGILVVRHANYVAHSTLKSGKREISNLFDFVPDASASSVRTRDTARRILLALIGPHQTLRMDDCCHRPVDLHVPCLRAEKELALLAAAQA